ncbi:MAG: CRTAC1 family protein [Gemmataceae bacterium]
MMTRFPSMKTTLFLVILAFGIGGVAGWILLRPQLPTGTRRGATRFRECAAEVGLDWRMHFLNDEQGTTFKINLYDHGSGVAIGDFDGDGLDDIYFANELGPNALYRNKGDGTFEDVAAAAGVALGDRVCVGATFIDYDNDGLLDLYVTSTRGGNVLFRNLGYGKFKDVTKEAGLTHVGHSQTGVFFDYDNDGLLDLFLTNTAAWTSDAYDKRDHYWIGKEAFDGVMLSPKESNVLYRNNGDGTFTDVTAKVGLKGRGWSGDAAAFDYNGDGRMDLFVACMFGRCQLYRNDGGHFTDVTLDVLGRTPWGAVGTKVLDLNNDGRLDLFVVDMHSDMWMGADFDQSSRKYALKSWNEKFPSLSGPQEYQKPSKVASDLWCIATRGTKPEELLFGNACYRNDGGGRFAEISDQAGLETFWPWGIADGDFDNDGLPDIFIPAGMGYPFYYWPNSLMMNQGDCKFKDLAEALGIEPHARGRFLPQDIAGTKAVRSSRTAAVADFFGDGRLDIVVNNFNDQPYFFKNEGPRRNYVAFRLRGTKSNRDAVGAVVRLYQKRKIMTRQVQAGGGYLSQCSRTVHFGLGEDTEIDRVEITWPSGTRQRLDRVQVNARQDIREPLPQER